MAQWPQYVTHAFKQLGYEDYATNIEAFANRWGGLEIEVFVRTLKEGHGQDKILAIFAIGFMSNTWARELLIPFLKSTQPMERWASALCLGKMKEEQAVPILINMLTEFFPPKEWPSYEGDDLWFYNGCRLETIFILMGWDSPEVVGALRNALQAYKHLEQLVPEHITTARRYWRGCQERVMYTLGYLGHFEVLSEIVKALDIVQPTLSSWRVYVALGSLQAHKTYPDVLRRSIPRKSELREQVMAVLHEQFGLSSEEQERCLAYYDVQRLW